MENKYFIKVEPFENANKWYKIEVTPSGLICTWGRVGAKGQTKNYPHSQYYKLVSDKLKKEYEDFTDKVGIPQTVSEELTNNPIIDKIIQQLMAFQKNKINQTYVLEVGDVTPTMIDEASSLVNNLSSRLSEAELNKLLVQIFTILPRKMGKVVNYLVNSQTHIPTVIERENDLLKMLKQQVVQFHISDDNQNSKVNLLEKMGLKFSLPDDSEINQIKEWLASHKNKYSQAITVTNVKSRLAYNNWIIENKVDEQRCLWHGSRNENWWSIIGSSLSLNPNAVITGKMFGHGLYFANSADKSLGYTSYNGSRWSNGSSNTAYLGLFDIAYGSPKIVYDHSGWMGDLTAKSMKEKFNTLTLHAKSDKGMLRKDEIIVYDEKQATIKYLVEVKN